MTRHAPPSPYATTASALASALSGIAEQVKSEPKRETYRGFVLIETPFNWEAWRYDTVLVADERSELEFMIDEHLLDDEAEFGSPLPITQTEVDIDAGRFDDCRFDGSPDAENFSAEDE